MGRSAKQEREHGPDQAPDYLRQMGLDEDGIRTVLGEKQKPEDFAVWPENWKAVEMFMSLQTQWRTGPMGGSLGLDYPGVAAALGLLVGSPRRRRSLFIDLQAMEAAALNEVHHSHE